MASKQKIILAYSGGLDTSIAIKWLQETYGYDVIAFCADVGEGKDLKAIKQKALDVGAIEAHVLDLKAVFAMDYLVPALQANALYEGIYPLISALSRPLIAKKLVALAHQTGAKAVAHGCTGKGNDQVRFDVAVQTLDPNLKIVAPVRESPMSREEAILYAHQHDIPLPIDLHNPFSIDLNLWGRSCECGVLEDPWVEPPEEAFAMTKPVAETPDEAVEITITFEAGIPTHLNGVPLHVACLVSDLNELAGMHGVGRIDHVENRLVGIKSREIYEAPAAVCLIQAHQALEALCLPRDLMHAKQQLEQQFATLVYDGKWYSPLMQALQAFMAETQKTVSGVVRMKLLKGQAMVVGRQSEQALYSHELATYQAEDAFDHSAALGFIKLWGLPSQLFSQVNGAT